MSSMSGDGQKSAFQSILRNQNFRVTLRHSDIQTYQGTHPLIESLWQQLKNYHHTRYEQTDEWTILMTEMACKFKKKT